MTRALRVFTSPSVVYLPRDWLQFTGAPSHRQQGEFLAVMARKDDLTDWLWNRRHCGVVTAAAITRGLRLNPAGCLPTPWQMLVDAGVVDLTVPGAYFTGSFQKGSGIVRMSPPPRDALLELEVVAQLDYHSSRGLFVSDKAWPW